MADDKDTYSDASKEYVEKAELPDSPEHDGYEASKRREEKHNDEWLKHKVNIIDVIRRFAPGAPAVGHGQKLIFEGERYNVVCDMAAGYLRIWDKVQRCYVDLNGNPDTHNRAHFKIKKREEM